MEYTEQEIEALAAIGIGTLPEQWELFRTYPIELQKQAFHVVFDKFMNGDFKFSISKQFRGKSNKYFYIRAVYEIFNKEVALCFYSDGTFSIRTNHSSTINFDTNDTEKIDLDLAIRALKNHLLFIIFPK